MKKDLRKILKIFIFVFSLLFSFSSASAASEVETGLTVNVNVSSRCGIYDSFTDETTNTPAVAKTYEKNMNTGELWNKENTGFVTNGATYIIVCNDGGGWEVTAAGSQASGRENKMTTTLAVNDIVTGTATSGATSNWAFKIASVTGTGVSIETGFNTYTSVPGSSGAIVARSSGPTMSEATFQTAYQVYIGTNTASGSYAGSVTYTLVHPPTASAPSENQPEQPQNGTAIGHTTNIINNYYSSNDQTPPVSDEKKVLAGKGIAHGEVVSSGEPVTRTTISDNILLITMLTSTTAAAFGVLAYAMSKKKE